MRSSAYLSFGWGAGLLGVTMLHQHWQIPSPLLMLIGALWWDVCMCASGHGRRTKGLDDAE